MTKDEGWIHGIKDGSEAFDTVKARLILEELHDFVAEHKIRCWIDQGVALGAYREGRLLLHDNDLDIGFRLQDAKPLLEFIPCLREKGYAVQIHCNNIYLLKDGIEINFMGYQKAPVDSSKYWLMDYISLSSLAVRIQQFYDISTHRTSQTINGRVATIIYKLTALHSVRRLVEPLSHLAWKIEAVHSNYKGAFYAGYWSPACFYDNLETIELYGRKWKIPSPPEDYLAFKYGEDWRKPKKKWNVWIDDGGVVRDPSIFQKLKLTTLTSCYGGS